MCNDRFFCAFKNSPRHAQQISVYIQKPRKREKWVTNFRRLEVGFRLLVILRGGLRVRWLYEPFTRKVGFIDRGEALQGVAYVT